MIYDVEERNIEDGLREVVATHRTCGDTVSFGLFGEPKYDDDPWRDVDEGLVEFHKCPEKT